MVIAFGGACKLLYYRLKPFMLTTLVKLKTNWLSIEPAETEQDTLLTMCIEKAGAIIKEICKQPIEAESVTIYFDGSTNNITANQILGGEGYARKEIFYTVPITITSLSHRTLPSDSWTADTSPVIYESNNQRFVYVSGGFGYRYYKLVATIGYTDIPASVELAASELAVEIYRETQATGASTLGVSSVSTTQGGVTITKAYRSVITRIMPYLSSYIIHIV